MKKYLQKINAKKPHERRELAAYAAAGVTGLVAIVWFSTLGGRLVSGGASPSGSGDTAGLMAATAEAGAAFQNQLQNLESDTSGNVSDSDVQAASSTPTAPVAAPATVIGSPNDPATELSSQ
ncbi:MAG: hypothetical protein ACREGH_01490 [Minisyncoccia bacterium]